MAHDLDQRPVLSAVDPPVLVAVLIAAHRTGDRTLEALTRRELERLHGIKIRFARSPVAGRCQGNPSGPVRSEAR